MTITRPDGTVTTLRYAPDPRFSGARYLTEKTIATEGGGIFYQMTINRIVELADEDDPFSLVEYREEVTINGRMTTTTFDPVTRTYTTIDPAGQEVMTQLDELGRPMLLETTDLAPVEYRYDDDDSDGYAGGRISSVTRGSLASSRAFLYDYDPETGFLRSITDPAGNTTNYQHDEMGRVLTETLPTGHLLIYAYDSAGNLIRHTNGQGVSSEFEYDSQNRMIAQTLDPEGRAVRTEYEYDTANNLITKIEHTEGLSVTTSYEWEPLDAAGNYVLSSVTDPLSGTTSYTYTPAGKIASITDQLARTTTISYTLEGWPEFVTAPDGSSTQTIYNSEGQPLEVIDARGSTTSYGYDMQTGRLMTVTQGSAALDGFGAVNQTTTYGYDVNGRIITITQALSSTVLTYDDFGRLIEIRDPLGNSSTLGYSLLDRVMTRTLGANIPDYALTIAYTYDDATRGVN